MLIDKESHLYRSVTNDLAKIGDHPQYQLWLDYALSTNERGKSLVQTIKNLDQPLKNKRHLDIGCAYGGACVAFASEGAESVGIDVDDRLLGFARENGRDHPELKIDFKKIDMMNWSEVKNLGKFDIVTCDNVIEHVSELGRLIALCSHILNPDGLIYITAPNAFSISQIEKDCHYSLFGISLLDPDDGDIYLKHAINQGNYDVSWYYRYGVFEHLFFRYGLSVQLLNIYEVSEKQIDDLYRDYQLLLAESHRLSEVGNLPEEIWKRVIYRLKHHIEMLETDILFYKETTDPLSRSSYRNQIYRDYHTELWYFVLRPNNKSIFGDKNKVSPAGYSTPININYLSGRKLLDMLWKKILKRIIGRTIEK